MDQSSERARSTFTAAVGTQRQARLEEIRRDLFRPLGSLGPRYLVSIAICGVLVLWAGFAWAYQIAIGIGVAGIRRPVFWGFYIVNFIFWIGISHAGTLISAILRLTEAGWRKPVTRAAEAITVFALMIGGLFPLIHLGRVWLFYWLIPYPNERLLWPNFRSPLLWDLTAIFTYITGSVLYLYLPLIPDLALLSSRSQGFRRHIYRLLSLGWQGSSREWHALERAMKLLAGIILAIAVSVHTVVSWDFAMALTPTWHSTIFGPYFVAGAIFSGIAALVLVMAALRRFLHLEAYLRPLHFDNLGKLLLLMSLVWGYFAVAEHLTIWYGKQPSEYAVLEDRVYGKFAPFFWAMVVLNFVVPFVLLGIRRLRTIRNVAICGVTVLAGMWLERFLIVVGTLSRPRLASAWGGYSPSWVEISITAGTFAGMALMYLVFAKLFPVIAVWEYDDVAHG
jgi:molybdopterin-containing oxidoreductase family membrane subunit